MIGPYAIEQDYSHYVVRSSGINFAVVGTASKGPIGVPTLCTSGTDLLRKFGPCSPEHTAMYAAKYYLNSGSNLYFVRASHQSNGTPSAAKATATVKVEKAAVVFTAVYAGTYYNNLKISMSLVSGTTYTVKVTENGSTVESVKIDISKAADQFKASTVVATSITTGTQTADTAPVDMTGGTDGTESMTTTDYVYYANMLKTSNVDMNLFAIPGQTDLAVVTAGIEIAESRGDCLYLVDAPSTCDTPDKIIAWHNGEGEGNDSTKLNSEYAALYWSWQYINDNGTEVLVPPSVIMGYEFSKAARESELWFPVAGVKRGLVHGVVKPQYAPNNDEVGALYSEDPMNCVNPIMNDPTYGLVVWGQKTLSRENSAMNRINVRMLVNYLKRVVVVACKYLTFEPNDQITWDSFEDLVEPTLRDIGNRRGLYEYKIVKGDAIVTNDDIDNYKMPCKIMLKPTKSAEYIPIYFTITSTGADFNEILESEGIIES